MGKVAVKVKHEGGQGVVRGLEAADTLERFITASLECLGLKNADSLSIKMLAGFPPAPLDISNRDQSIESTGIKTGDTIIFQLSEKTNAKESEKETSPTKPAASQSSSQPEPPATSSNDVSNKTSNEGESTSKRQKLQSSSRLMRKVVPADNSCLFTSINFCMCQEVLDGETTRFMRDMIASTVSGDKEKYSEAILGRDNTKYCEWIQTLEAWGGALELQILADSFEVEIDVVDTKSGSLTRFGEFGGYRQRMILIYDGIHYDPLFREGNQQEITTVFPVSDQGVLDDAKELAEEARAAHNYTDTASFTLKCLVCGHRMAGETEAQAHAAATKHINFSEV